MRSTAEQPRPEGRFPRWALLVAPLVTLVVSNADVLLFIAAHPNRATGDLKLALAMTIPLSAAACGLTMWLLLRLRNEVDRRSVTEAQLRTALEDRGAALNDLGRALERDRMLRQELDHRVRNNLSSLMGLVGLYEESSISPPDLVQSLRGKIAALREVYGLIGATRGEGIDLAELLSTVTDGALSIAGSVPIAMRGPPVRLMSREANALAMIVQELVTNSVKHGALRDREGAIRIDWETGILTDGTRLSLRWVELPVRDASEPQGQRRNGIGLTLIEGFACSDLRGGVRFSSVDGRWVVDIVANLRTPAAAHSRSLAPQEILA